MLEELYTFYLPKKTHPWCYISLEIEPQNVDVNVHPTKQEVKFLHENAIIEKIKQSLDERLSGNSASRTFYVQARLPKADITKEVLKEVLPEYEQGDDKTKKIRPQEMIRTDSSDQKLDKFNFTIHTAMKHARNVDTVPSDNRTSNVGQNESVPTDNMLDKEADNVQCLTSNADDTKQKNISTPIEVKEKEKSTPWSDIINDSSQSTSSELIVPTTSNLASTAQSDNKQDEYKLDDIDEIFEMTNDSFDENIINDSTKNKDDSIKEKCIDVIADKARKQVYKCFGNKSTVSEKEETTKCKEETKVDKTDENKFDKIKTTDAQSSKETDNNKEDDVESKHEFKSYSINNFRREVKLTSVLKLRKEVENECHEGLREILAGLSFVGCIDESSALIQSGVNLYLCDTKKLA